MDYKKHYELLLSKHGTQDRPEGYYTECHHIIPRSMGGSDDVENLTHLTAKAHFIAHYLLWKIHGTGPMGRAFWAMAAWSKGYRANSRSFEAAKRARSESMVKPVNIYIYKTGELVAEDVSMTQWSRENGVQQPALSLTANYKRKHTMGFYARYVGDYEGPLKGVKMIKRVYTLATSDLEILDRGAITTLEVAEKLRDRMVEMFNRNYYVVNIKTFNSKD